MELVVCVAAVDEAAAAALEPELELPLVAPVAAMRASRSAAVVQVMLVPAELTNGRAAQLCAQDQSQEIVVEVTNYSHQARAARLGDELAVDTLSKLVVYAGILTGLARGVRGQGLELVAEGEERATGVSGYT